MKRQKSPCYCINLRRAAGFISSVYDTYLEPMGITVNQYSLLRNLGRMEVCNVSELAARVGLERTTVVRMLNPLMERGLISDQSEASRKSRRLQLTAEGKMLIAQSVPLWEAAQADIERRIGREKVETLISILEQLESS